MKSLSAAQVDLYNQNGFLSPLPGLLPEEAQRYLDRVKDIEAFTGAPITQKDQGLWRSIPYVYLTAFDQLIRDPRILDVIEDLIGPDILVWTGTFFPKEPKSPTFAAWHQDSTYFGLSPHTHVTAWIALSPAPREAGCMEVVAPAGAPRQLRHAAARLKDSINGAGQHIDEPFDDKSPICMELKQGQFSLHHTLTPHRSLPNSTSYRRVGFGISYIPASTKLNGPHRVPAMLVRGTDKWGNFDTIKRPDEDFSEAALAEHKRVYNAYRQNYEVQVRHHDERFAAVSA